MNAERLERLIEAYGAAPRRWPQDERAAAERLLAERPDLRAALQIEADLDHRLDAAPNPRPSMALHDRVLASAIQAGRGGRSSVFGLSRPLAWLAGAGLAAATCAGALSGMALTTHMTADARAEAVYAQASFGVIDDAEVLG